MDRLQNSARQYVFVSPNTNNPLQKIPLPLAVYTIRHFSRCYDVAASTRHRTRKENVSPINSDRAYWLCATMRLIYFFAFEQFVWLCFFYKRT